MQLTDSIIPRTQVTMDDLMSVQSQIKNLSLRNFKRLNLLNHGTRQSSHLGGNMEYEESRAYVVGDDIKNMDWRVMARTGEAHTKVFSNEQEKSLILAVDLSSSMFFGTRYSFKSWTAAQLAAHFGWLVNTTEDRLGATIVCGEKSSIVKPSINRNVLSIIFQVLCRATSNSVKTDSKSTLDTLLSSLNRQAIKGSLVILISDFLGITTSTRSLLSQLERHNDIGTFWIHDQTEVTLWPEGNYPVQQGNQFHLLDTSNETTQNWLVDCQNKHRESIEGLISKNQINHYEISCNNELANQLYPFLSTPHDS